MRSRAGLSLRHLALVVLLSACSGTEVGAPPPPPPAPAIDAIFPSAAVAGSPDLTLTITGNNFVDGRFMGSHAAWLVGGATVTVPIEARRQ